jgi:hypothetical protein
LSDGYQEKLIKAFPEPEVDGETGTGYLNNNVKITIFTTSSCPGGELPDNKWDRRTEYKPAAPCPAIEIVAGAAAPVTLRDALTVGACPARATRSWF